MTISVGDRLPEGTLKKATPEGAEDVQVKDFFAGRKVVLFGVPGAFTPTCSSNHLPGFVENNDTIRERGVDEIAVLSVNDHHVMGAWARFTGAEDHITFLADGNGEYIKKLGLEADLSVAGLGVRSSRFSMVVEDGVVKKLNVEDSPGKTEKSGAAKILEQI